MAARGLSPQGAGRPFEIGRVADRFIPHSCGYLGVHPFADRSDYPEIKCLPGLAQIAGNHFLFYVTKTVRNDISMFNAAI
jgi:hypothetical protein